MKPEKPRHKGKRLACLSKETLETIALAQAMELVDDLTLLKMRAKQLVQLLGGDKQDNQ